MQLDASVTEIANNGLSMSGGQRKKLLMMRLLLGSQNVSVLILDELEAGLDAEAKAHLIQLKKNLVEMRKDAIRPGAYFAAIFFLCTQIIKFL